MAVVTVVIVPDVHVATGKVMTAAWVDVFRNANAYVNSPVLDAPTMSILVFPAFSGTIVAPETAGSPLRFITF